MKKQLLLLVMVLLPMLASADESGTCGSKATWIFEEATGTLTIGGSGAMGNYEIGGYTPKSPWFNIRSKIVKTIIEDGITYIGRSSFYLCSAMISISIPNSVKRIGDNAFTGCSALTSINIPNGVTSIGSSAFSSCSALTSINIPNGVTSIESNVFSDCSALTSINIPNGVTSIGSGAFSRCSALTSINIPNGVTSIESIVFSDCSALTSINIPNGVTSIGSSAFSSCSALTSINIPNGVTSIESSAFKNCSNLTTIALSQNLKLIKQSTFKNCSKIESLIIPSKVEVIYQEAFDGCNNLKEIIALPTIPPTSFDNTFSHYSATLSVPKESAKAYQSTSPWSNFTTIKALDGETPTTPQCAKPLINYQNGKLTFDSETDDAEYNYTIINSDNKTGKGKIVELAATYNISVYATKSGYLNSDVATATLCWIDQTPKTEGITNVVAQIAARPVLVKTDNGFITVEGADDRTNVSVYTTDGKQVGSTISQNNIATIATSIQPGSIAIIKVGEKAIKVVIK